MAVKTKIKCPVCGYEYLPAEIYIADDFVGNPRNIIKDENGEVLGYEGSDMNTTETYICDHCDTTFTVEAIVTFKTAPIKDVFDDDDTFVSAGK